MLRPILQNAWQAIALSALLLLAPKLGAAQGSATKNAHAVRINSAAPRIDGVLDDAAWQQARVISDFVQKIPNEGGEPRARTEVLLLYDETALYVGARDPATKRWPGWVDDDPQVRLGIDGKLYDVALAPMDETADADTLKRLRAVYAAKYELPAIAPDAPPGTIPATRYWRVGPRGQNAG